MGILKYIAGKLYSNDKEVALVDDGSGIESSTLPNGYWTKYPDGTYIVSENIVTGATIVCSTQAGSLFYGVRNNVPINISGGQFMDAPTLVVIGIAASGGTIDGAVTLGLPSGITPTEFSVAATCWATGGTITVGYTAIGRWK